MTCAPTATRTRDLPLRRRSLYPLSYRGLPGPLAYLGWQVAVVLVLCRAATSSKVAPGTQRAASRICSQAVWPGAIRGASVSGDGWGR